MYIKNWNKLPKEMQNAYVKPYYEILRKKKIQLLLKRIFDSLG